jgi:hypothetical protein
MDNNFRLSLLSETGGAWSASASALLAQRRASLLLGEM